MSALVAFAAAIAWWSMIAAFVIGVLVLGASLDIELRDRRKRRRAAR